MCLQINRRIYTTIAAMLTLCATAMAQTDTIRYVKTTGSYTADGRSWANAKSNLQDAINDLYDYLQRNNLKSGRVLVAEGKYTPTETTASDADGVLNTSFKIYEGITVYGGFAKDETNDKIQPSDRVITDTDGKFQWVFAHKTILSGNHSLSSSGNPLTWNDNETKMQYDESFPGNSYHVVWFATNGFDSKGRANALAKTACVDGCEIREGYASNRTVTSRSHTSYGGGAYMTEGAILRKCILTQNAAKRRGGAVYMDGGGRMENCYVTRNQTTGVGLTDGQGGGVCMEDGAPVVMHCIIENNSARIGGGLAIWTDRDYSTTSADSVKLFYQPAAMGCIVNNNTSSTEAGGVLMRGGTINHLTVTANQCTGQDITYENRRMGRSAGIYVDEGAQIVNSVFWGGKVDNRNVQYAAYTRNSIANKYEPYVRYSAFSAYEHTDWTGTTKQGVLSLSSENRKTTENGYFPQFRQPTNDGGSNAIVGVVKETTADDYPRNQNWKPDGTSQLRAQGVQVTDLNDNANIIQSHITQDYGGANYVAKTVLGAIVPYEETIVHVLVASLEKGESTMIPTLFVDPATGKGYTADATEVGSSWTQPLSTINDALGYFRSHQSADGTWTFSGTTYNNVQILVKEGVTNCVGNYLYGSLRTSNLNMVSNVRLYGGYSSELDNADVSSIKRNPVKYITRITADISGNGYTYNSCHIINLSNVTGTVIDGFQIYYANAYDPSNDFKPANKNGAGVICGNTNTATGTEIDMSNTLRNCVIANCKGEQGAALYVSSRTKSVTLNVENCIIHNNMAMASSNPAVITATESGTILKLNHCTVRGNVGYGVLSANGAKVEFNNSALHANASAPKAAVADLASSDIRCFANAGGTYSGSNNIIDNGQSYPSGITESAATLTYTAPASGTLSTTYPKFVNPTRNVGINEEGDVTMYGGDPNWMPTNTNPMVNAANETGTSATDPAFGKDITANIYRNYGGAADIGAVENHNEVAEGDTSNEDVEGGYMPPYGKVIYVRDYRKADGTIDYDRDGDGSSWQNAINGNLEIDKYKNNHSFGGVDAELYEEGYQLTGLQWAVDEAFARSLERDENDDIKYTTISGVTHFSPGSQSTVNPDRTTIDVSTVDKNKRVQVWIGEGEYIRREGFFMRDAVDVYGGFPGKGGSPLTPGMKERKPKTSILETLTNDEASSAGTTGSGDLWGPQVDDYAHKVLTAYSSGNITNSWSVVDFSSDDAEGNAPACIDENTNTFWHSRWQNNNAGHGTKNGGLPQWIIIDMGQNNEITSLKITNRNYYPNNYTIGYASSYSDDGAPQSVNESAFRLIWNNNNITAAKSQTLDFGKTISCQYLYIKVNSNNSGQKHVDILEIEAYNGSTKIDHLLGSRVQNNVYDLNSYAKAYKSQRVLTQPYPYFKGKGNINGSTQGNNLEFDNDPFNPFSVITSWDGFVIRNGRTKITHQRDGGAGVALRINGRLANCVITNNVLSSKSNTRGAGVFQNGGIIENCEIDGNILNGEGGNDTNVYGGGLYQRTGTVFNTSVIKNKITGSGDRQGTGVFFENGRFYNNTITANEGPLTLYSGSWFSNGRIDVYNSIIFNNNTPDGSKEFNCDDKLKNTNITFKNCLFKNSNSHKSFDDSFTNVDASSFVYMDDKGMTADDLFNDAAKGDYSLKEGAIAINMGTDQLGKNMEGTADIVLPSYDAQYADRIQDCTVDIGAYEFNGAYSITPDIGSSGEAVYYVTQNGAGNASAANPENAACWQKLQKVLDAAGRYKLSNQSKRVIVKLAKFDYMPRRSTESNATEENPRTYSIIVPKGVEVWGGYSDTDDFAKRDVIGNKTTLSGLYQSEGQDVNVYHVVTFTEDTFDENGNATEGALASITDKAVLDGLFIENGDAEGEPVVGQDFVESRYGGAAIVKKYAHVRNCIIRNNKAVDGGGAFCMEQGALVTGCVIDGNSALSGRGGAIYVRNTTVNSNAIEIDTNIARVMASTIVNNSAEKDGGGIYFGEAKVRVNSAVIWKNSSNGDHNVCGQTDPGATDASQERNIEGYPLSYCAVENLSVAGINNISVSAEDNQGVRFESIDHTKPAYYKPKEYSVLVRSGMEYGYWTTKLTTAYPSLETEDFANVNRTGFDNGYIEIGARAIDKDVKVAPKNGMLMKRIYVASPTASEVDMTYAEVLQNLASTEYYSQRGSSQAFPMLYLDDALEYVRSARKDNTISNIADTEFEIFLRAGTYTPRRDIKGTRSELSRGNTYLVPEGVSIIGGLGKDAGATGEFYGKDDADKSFTSGTTTVTIKAKPTSEIQSSRETYDNNKNNIIEPWEFKYISELSGSVTNGSSSLNVFHVISCIADKNYVGELPTDPSFTNATPDGKTHIENGKTILLDGVKISNGNALNYDETTAESATTYYRGGAICVDGNWTTDSEGHTKIYSYEGIDRPRGYRNIPLEIHNCKFIDNKGGLGGAIYTNGELKIFTSTFVRNTAQEGNDSDGGTGTITFDGRGGAINASSNTTIVNSVFANNEATAAATSTSTNPGYGGAISLGEYSSLHMLNCDVVRNKAVSYPAIYAFTPNQGYTASDADKEETLKTKNPHKIVNTILWGNEISSTSGSRMVFNFSEDAETKHAEALWFCAYEDGTGLTPLSHPHEGNTDFRKQEYGVFGLYIPYLWKNVTSETKYIKDGLSAVTNNIIISSNNDLTDGPNFISPSTTAGAKGHNESADWMIGRINNLTDNGWTYLEQNDDKTAFVKKSGSEEYDGNGIYYSTRYAQNNPTLAIGDETYMKYADGTDNIMLRISLDPNPTHYQSYIDIGAYEYQHVQLVPSEEGNVDVLWVTEQENQSAETADGRTWETATSDLQRAIETLLASRNNHRKEIRLLEGQYQPVYTINNNLGFNINTEMHNSAVTLPSDASLGYYGVASLTIQGGWSKSVKGQYSIKDYPAYLFSSERTGVSDDKLSHILMVDCAQQVTSYRSGNNVLHYYKDEVVPITLEGLIFCNTKGKKHTDSDGKECNGGAAVFYKPQYKKTDGSTTTTDLIKEASNYFPSDLCKSNLYKKLTIRQCDIRVNGDRTHTNPLPAVTIEAGGGDALIYNTVFHSNAGNPLEAVDTKVINCTFAKNGGHVVFYTNEQSTSELHNSLFWKNDIFVTGDNTRYDVVGLSSSENMTHNAMTSLSADDVTNNNYKLSETNGDVLNGPNFKNPADDIDDKVGSSANLYAMALRDFNVLPSAMVIGKADPKLYINKVYSSSFDYTKGADDNQKIEDVRTFLSTINTKKDNTEKAEGITLGHETYRADASDVADKDLGYQNRMYGTAGMELGAYECIASLQQVLYYNPNRPNGGDGKAWATAYGKSELQTAIDAAAVYPQVMKVTDKNAYVIAKGGNNTGESIVMRDGVTLIGSVYKTYLKQHNDVNAEGSDLYPKVVDYLKRVVYDRAGLAADGHDLTTVKGVTAYGDAISNAARFDGLEISNEDATSQLTSPVINFTAAASSDKGVLMLANTIVHDNNMAEGIELATVNSGLLYNVLFRNNSQGTTTSFSTTTPGTGSGYMVNCTVAPNSMRPAVGNTAHNIIATEYSHFAPYLGSESVTIPYTMPKTYGKNLWYQLVETSSHIDKGSTETPLALPTNLQYFIHFDQDLDLLGNPRLISTKVDYGCFETWSTKNSMLKPSAADYHYPHSGSVVYVDASYPLVCEKDQFSTVKQNVLKPAYVLVGEGGSLYGQGNELEFDYLAVERGMTDKYALAAVPYRFNITEGITKGGSSLKALDTGELSLYSYDGNARAAWNYNYASSNSGLWKGLTSDIVEPNEGFLIERASAEAGNVKYRFTNAPQIVDGIVMPAYSENGSEKTITLQQYDNCESNNDGYDFTSVYNMGWNLKGMPYLISNYPAYKVMDDETYAMNVPHVVYTMKADGSYYVARQSWTTSTENTLSPGVAFFTQTATLNLTENLHFAQLFYTSSSTPNSANTRSAVTISLAPANATGADASGSVGVSPAAGAVSLLPVESISDEPTSLVYTINRDGAKFMSMNPAVPDIAVCGVSGEMMSLVGAAPVETEMSVATRVGTTGRYTFSLDRSAGVSPATTEVWLKDYQTGIVTNLMEDDYTAEITTGENPTSPVLTTGRFSLTIGGVRPDIGERDENSARWTISINHCHVSVSGLSTDSDVLFYTTDGILRHSATPFLGKCEAELAPGVYVVRAEGNSKVIGLVRRDK